MNAAEITNEGLRFDRQYVLVKPPTETQPYAEHITIKWRFDLGLFHTSIDKAWSKLTITHSKATEQETLVVPLSPSPLSLLGNPTYKVSIFGTEAEGIDMGPEAAAYFTHHLDTHVRLLYIGGSGQREIPGAAYIPKNYRAISISVNDKLQPQRLRFADAAPLLITSVSIWILPRLETEHQLKMIFCRRHPRITLASDCPQLPVVKMSSFDFDQTFTSMLARTLPLMMRTFGPY